MTQKPCPLIPVILLFYLWATVLGASDAQEGDDENLCVDCHTNLKQLMDLSWKVKNIKPKTAVSKKISGEG